MPEAPKNSLFENKLVQVVIIILLVSGAYYLGSLKTKLEILQKGTGLTASGTQPTGTTQQQGTAQTGTSGQTPKITLAQVKDAFGKSQIKFGDGNKKLILVEVADPSCPYCHVAGGLNGELNKQVGDRFTLVSDGGTYVAPVPEMKKLVDGGKASFAYIYTPGHGNGEMGTKALYCAHEKNKFWEVHDVLMTNAGYNLLNNTVKNDKAKSAQLADFLKSVFDSNDMKTCLDSGKYDARLTQDTQIASGIGITGTPGFYINDTLFAGAYSYKDMQPAVTAILQ